MRNLFLLFLTLFALFATAQEQRTLTISGHLVDAEMKEPMAHATVQLF